MIFRSRQPGLTKVTDRHDSKRPAARRKPAPATPRRGATRHPFRLPRRPHEEARLPALALLDRLFATARSPSTELGSARSVVLGGRLDELLVPALDAEAPPIPAGHSIGDHLRAQGVLR